MTEEDDDETGDSGLGTGSGGACYLVRESELGIVNFTIGNLNVPHSVLTWKHLSFLVYNYLTSFNRHCTFNKKCPAYMVCF